MSPFLGEKTAKAAAVNGQPVKWRSLEGIFLSKGIWRPTANEGRKTTGRGNGLQREGWPFLQLDDDDQWQIWRMRRNDEFGWETKLNFLFSKDKKVHCRGVDICTYFLRFPHLT
jgi:hypothetical protein